MYVVFASILCCYTYRTHTVHNRCSCSRERTTTTMGIDIIFRGSVERIRRVSRKREYPGHHVAGLSNLQGIQRSVLRIDIGVTSSGCISWMYVILSCVVD